MFKGIVFFIKNGWKYDKKYILWRVFYQLVNSMLPIVATITPKLIIDELMGSNNATYLFAVVLTLVGYTAIASILSEYFSWDGFTRRCRVAEEFDSDLHRRLANADYAMLENPEFLDMQEKARKFLYCDWHGFGYLLDCAMNALGQIFTLIGISAIVLTIDVKILILFVVLIIVSALIEKKAKKRAVNLSQEVSQDQREWMYYASLFQEHSFAKEIRLYSIGEWLLNKERACFVRINDNQKRQNDGFFRSGSLGALFTFVQQLVAYIYLIYSVSDNRITIGSFTMYMGAVTSFSIAFRAVLDSVIEIKAFDLYYDRLDEYLKLPCTMREGKREVDACASYVIEFQHVYFKYAGSEAFALRDVNIKIPFGQKLSIVGENGAGKTTFIKLLTRMYSPTSGQIMLNGVNVNEYDYDQYMELLAPVFQDFKLFSFSLRDNVSLGLEADDKEIESLLQYVGLGEKLKELPNGLGTSVYKIFDENGFEPSGGEGQKIALARALYKKAPIILLDEPTAAMDPKAEYEMYQKFNAMVHDKTAIYISHRLSSAKFCDVIAVFSQGQIAEYGTHIELMKKQGIYKELFTMQSQFYI